MPVLSVLTTTVQQVPNTGRPDAFHFLSALPGIPADQADAAKSVPLLAGAIDARNFAARNVGVTPAQLYARLDKESPLEDDFVVVHGDPWLSNILIDPSGDVGFVDCGRSGRPVVG